MKAIIILGDGMADYPIASLGGKTPLQTANKPHMDKLASIGRNGLFKTVPDDMPPGSEVANMAILGYDVRSVYQGRGVLEAAAIGVKIGEDDLAMRCNLICLQGEKIKNHSAGHISTEEAHILIDVLNRELGSKDVSFHHGVSYRHVLLLKNGSTEVELTPPHDVPGSPWKDVLPRPKSDAGQVTADILTDLIVRSQTVLSRHPVNQMRIAHGKDPANSIWVWSAGKKPNMRTFTELFNKSGAVISAVDLLHGIGVYAGFKNLYVEGATGLYNTNYEGKVEAALDAISKVDIVYLHIEAADEASHEGDIALKIKCIEAIDNRVLRPIMEATAQMDEPIALALLPDHATPCEVRTHVHDPVPFVIYKPGMKADSVQKFDETSAQQGAYGLISNGEFIRLLFND